MRRALLIGVSVLAAALLAAATTNSATQIAPKQVSCKQDLLVFLFWPHGHGAIRSVGFSAYKPPHMEIYKYGAGYPNSSFLAFGAATKVTSFAKSCRGKAGAGPAGSIPGQTLSTSKLALTCAVPRNALIRMKPVSGGLQIEAGTPSSRVVSARLTKAGSKLNYSKTLCRPGPAPH